MADAAPPPMESWVDRTIREAIERGEFDDLPGAGKPLPVLAEPYEPNWWVRRWMEREGITAAELRAARRRDAPP